MKTLRPVMILSVLIVLLLGTAQPAAAATIRFTSGPPPSPVTAYQGYPGHTFTATGDTTISFSLASGSLPVGMALSSVLGTLSGTPTTPGTYTFTVRANGTPSGAFADQDVAVVVVAPKIKITSGKPKSRVTAYQPYPTHTFNASGGTAPYSLTLRSGSLPIGMALSSVMRTLSGTPITPGTYSFRVRVLDANGFFADQDVTVRVVAPKIKIISGTPASPVTAYEPYPTHTFTASGGTGPYSVSLRSGSLPVGMALSSSLGTLSGTPTTAGSYTFGIRITDKNGFFADQDMTVVVVAPTIIITSGTPTSPWYTGQPYPTHTFTASGGTAPYSVSLRSGSLPVGMALSSSLGTLSGTPTVPGSYTFGIRMTDKNGFFADQDVTVVIDQPL